MVTLEERLKRISDVKGLLLAGATISEIARQLKVTDNTIRKDIEKIKTGFIESLKAEAFDNLCFELGLNFEEISKRLWNLFFKSENENIRLGALNSLTRLLSDKTGILGRLGLIEYVEKHQHEIGFDYERFRDWCQGKDIINSEGESSESNGAPIPKVRKSALSISKKTMRKSSKKQDSKQKPADRN